MKLFKYLKVVFKVTDCIWEVIWLLGDLTLIGRESFPVDPTFCEGVPVDLDFPPTF